MNTCGGVVYISKDQRTGPNLAYLSLLHVGCKGWLNASPLPGFAYIKGGASKWLLTSWSYHFSVHRWILLDWIAGGGLGSLAIAAS